MNGVKAKCDNVQLKETTRINHLTGTLVAPAVKLNKQFPNISFLIFINILSKFAQHLDGNLANCKTIN